MVGSSERAGVTRTLYEFNSELPQSQFRGIERHGLVLDLKGNEDLELAEILVLLRNELVGAVDRAARLRNVEIHLFDFDASWAIWKQLFYGDQRHFIEVRPSAHRKLTKAVLKKIFVIGTGGLFEALNLLDGAPDGLASFMGDKASGAGVEAGSESWFDRQGGRAADFFMTKIAPRINPRIRDFVDEEKISPDDIAVLMLPMLLRAVDEIASKLRGKQFTISVDAIDVLEGMEAKLTMLRAVISRVLYDGSGIQLSTILAGRGPVSSWLEELDGAPFDVVGPMGEISKDAIEQAWRAKVDPRTIQAVIDYACGAERVTTANLLDEGWHLNDAKSLRGRR
jgi:hypothetical protein